MAACGGCDWSTAAVPEERPALDGGASDIAGSAVGSGRAVSDMIDTELSSVKGRMQNDMEEGREIHKPQSHLQAGAIIIN